MKQVCDFYRMYAEIDGPVNIGRVELVNGMLFFYPAEGHEQFMENISAGAVGQDPAAYFESLRRYTGTYLRSQIRTVKYGEAGRRLPFSSPRRDAHRANGETREGAVTVKRLSSGRRQQRSAARDPNEKPETNRTAHPNRAASVKVTPKKDNAKPRPHGIVASGKTAKSERMPYVARRDRASTRTPDSAQSPLSAGVILSVDIGIHLQPDTVVNRDGQRVWLKEAFTSTGRRIGVGPCCLESTPCEWHEPLSRMARSGYPRILSGRVH
jgi:hypothetical protein